MVLGPRSLSQIAFSFLPPLPSPPPCLFSICHLPSTTLPRSFLLTNKPPLAYPCIPPLSHTDTFASAHTFPRLKHARIPMHAHSLAHTQTCALPTQLLLGSQNWYAHTQTTPVHPSGPPLVQPLPVRSTQHTALPTALLLADTPPWAAATRPSPSEDCLLPCCFPSSSLSSRPLPALRIAPAIAATATSAAATAELSGPPEPASPALGASCPGSLGASEDRRTGSSEV